MEVRSHYQMPDDAAPQDCEIWRESELPEDKELRARRERIKTLVFQVAFGGLDGRRKGEPLPFFELPDEAVALMPPALLADYEAELASARDPRGGCRVRPA